MTKSKIYELFAYILGYKIKSDKNGNYGRLSDYPLREHHDILWPIGSPCLHVCSWAGFRIVWDTHFPWLFIRKKYMDVCDQCVLFQNKFRHT